MTGILSRRSAGISAILFAVVFVGAALVLMGQVQSDTTKDDLADTYGNAGFRSLIVAVGAIAVIATAPLAIFTTHLLARLREAEGGDGPLSRLAPTAVLLLLVTWIVGTFAQLNVAASIEFGDGDIPSVESAFLFSQLGTGLVLVGSLFSAAGLMALTAAISFATGAFPRWAAWLSVVCAFALLFGAIFLPAIAFPVWLVAMGFQLLRGEKNSIVVASPADA